MKSIPRIFIFSRAVIGILMVVFSILHINHYKVVAIVLFAVGLLTDIFDGIIARQLGISTQKLRRMDSTADQVFFILVAIATYIESPTFFYTNRIQLIILFGAEGLAYLICFLKFKKEVATHAILSKIWTLILFATIIEIMATGQSAILFEICFYVGLITRGEIIAIIFVLREWTNDVPTLYQAILLRQGKPIKRHKIFNG